MEYKQYLQTDHWQNKRKLALTKPQCRLCGKKNKLQLHHKRYYRNNNERIVKIGLRKSGSILFDEGSEDLILLCASCHKMWHRQFGKLYMDKHIIKKIRTLIKFGVVKKIAFNIAVKQKELYPLIYQQLKNRSIRKNTYNPKLFNN